MRSQVWRREKPIPCDSISRASAPVTDCGGIISPLAPAASGPALAMCSGRRGSFGADRIFKEATELNWQGTVCVLADCGILPGRNTELKRWGRVTVHVGATRNGSFNREHYSSS